MMRDAIVFAGTSEGRQLYDYCAGSGINALFCVATDYGSQTLDKLCKLDIRTGRMTAEEMADLFSKERPRAVIDATHPYAAKATAQIQEAVRRYRKAQGIEDAVYYRVLRGTGEADCPPDAAFDSMRQAVEYLNGTKGNILAAVGSKELDELCKLNDFAGRLYLRILPNPDILQRCLSAGLAAGHMICMQGPFTEEMNRAMLAQYQIGYLLTKMSGDAGGYPEKYRAAKAAGAKLVAVLPPKEPEGICVEEAKKVLEALRHDSGKADRP